MAKRGQAAMEFLMTYGWAILAAIIAIAALAYFGVFSPGMSSIDPNKKFVILATLNFDVVAQRLAEKTGEFNKYPKIIYNTGSNPLAVFLKEDEKQSFSQVSCKEIISKA